jgi:hypothetical protein
MGREQVQEMVAAYDKGWISAEELAEDFLFQLMVAPELESAFNSSFEALPDAAKREFFDLMAEIREAKFCWEPSIIGVPPDKKPEPTRYSVRLRQLHDLLTQLPGAS